MAITLYKDSDANAIFISDASGAQFLNSLQATLGDGATCNILDAGKGILLASGLPYTDFIDENGDPYGTDEVSTCDALNSLFGTSGTDSAQLPVITSNLVVNSVEGEVINYEMTADYGVGYEWDNLPAGMTTVEGNVRKLIGGSGLGAGTYLPIMRAINYNGEDVANLTIEVGNPPFSNTKSVSMQSNDYLNGTANLVPSLARASNGSGAADAWSIGLYFKRGTHTGGSKQTLFYYGDSDHDNSGHIWIYFKGSDKCVYLEYGSKNSYIRLKTPTNTLGTGWHHLLFSYNGAITGASSGSLSNYYSSFDIAVDSVSQTTDNSEGNNGWAGSVTQEVLYVGKRAGGKDYLRNGCKVDELAVWNSDQSGNAASIFNSGDPFDLSTLSPAPANWWRIGDGDTFPTLQDSTGSADLTMTNMSSSDIINDTP